MEKGRIGLYTLLIVDDEEIEREGMAQFIPWDSYEMKVVSTARNGAEGLEKIAKYRPDLAIVDIKMPVMNGLEATKIIRESNTEIPIIMQTAYAFSSDKENAMNAGATEVLVKPITLSILRTTLSKYLPDLQW